MASRNAERSEAVTRGTGNVFADLGFPDAAERQAKQRLTYALNQVLEERKLSQADAAKVLGVTQPKVSALETFYPPYTKLHTRMFGLLLRFKR